MCCLGCFSLVLKCLALCTRATAGFQWPGHLDGPPIFTSHSVPRQVCICQFFQMRTSSTCWARDSRVCQSLGVNVSSPFCYPTFFVAFVFFFGFALIAVIVTCSLFSDFPQCQHLPTSTLESSSPFATFQSQECSMVSTKILHQ